MGHMLSADTCVGLAEVALRGSSGALIRAGHPGVCKLKMSDAAVGLSAAQVQPDLPVEVLPGIAGGHRNPNLPNGNPDLRAELQQFRPDGANLSRGQVRTL